MKLNDILIINKDSFELVGIMFEFVNYSVYTKFTLEEGYQVAKNIKPHVILIDTDFEKDKIIKYCKLIKENLGDNCSIIITCDIDEDEEDYLKVGVSDFINKPYKNSIIKLRIDNQLKFHNLLKQANDVSITDELTKLPNRRAFNRYIEKIYNEGLQNNKSMTVIMCDIDHFKNFNDTYGHDIGDEVLKLVSRTFKNTMNGRNCIFRWGGEEFCLVLYDVKNENAIKVADILRKDIMKQELDLGSVVEKITISLGVFTGFPKDVKLLDDFKIRADEALYQAKETGRNKVVDWNNI